MAVEMSRRCTSLWRETHFEVRMLKQKSRWAFHLGCSTRFSSQTPSLKNKMQPTNPNAHMYVNGTDVETHGYAVTQNTFLQ